MYNIYSIEYTHTHIQNHMPHTKRVNNPIENDKINNILLKMRKAGELTFVNVKTCFTVTERWHCGMAQRKHKDHANRLEETRSGPAYVQQAP